MDKIKQGKKNKASGARFELKVRKDLESKGWIVSKWQNNIEFYPDIKLTKQPIIFKKGYKPNEISLGTRLIPAKRKFNPFNKVMMMSSGFPDFIAYKIVSIKTPVGEIRPSPDVYDIIGVESKSNGYLTQEERAKCRWMLENNIFSRILVARKSKKRGEIEYEEIKP